MNKAVIMIPRTREHLCCARALVTARAKLENHWQWRAFQQGGALQLSAATQLHATTGEPLGVCRDAELKQFAAHSSMVDYIIVVVDADRNFETFAYGSGPKHLGLLHEGHHYDVIESLPVFFWHQLLLRPLLQGL